MGGGFCGGFGLDFGLVPVGLLTWFWFGLLMKLVWFFCGSGFVAGLVRSLGCNIFLMVNWPTSLGWGGCGGGGVGGLVVVVGLSSWVWF